MIILIFYHVVTNYHTFSSLRLKKKKQQQLFFFFFNPTVFVDPKLGQSLSGFATQGQQGCKEGIGLAVFSPRVLTGKGYPTKLRWLLELISLSL